LGQCCGFEIIIIIKKIFRSGSGFNLNFGSGSGSGSSSGSGLFMKNTFELQICRSSKHCKKLIYKICKFLTRIVDEKYI
jgi:hypothetical protein